MQFHEKYEEVSRKLEELLNRPNLFVFGRVDAWLKAGADPETEIYPICMKLAGNGRWNGSSLAYFDNAIAQAIADRTKPLPVVEARRERTYERKADPVYAPRPELPQDVRDKIDRGLAEMLNKGMNVMSVTYQDAKRMAAKGWLNQQAAERFGL
jgi:hypothetical protein